jgi:glutamyl/glutaminyl-tRNA synthetase
MPLRGRLAPTPTGLLHVGHARTFGAAMERAGSAGLVLRIEDLDEPRCRPAYRNAALEDLAWLGIRWTEGPDIGGPFGPYLQSERSEIYAATWRTLATSGVIYPSPHSRRDVAAAATAPQEGDLLSDDGEQVFPPSLRPSAWSLPTATAAAPAGLPWRFRVPDGRTIRFEDGRLGVVERKAGVDFGDFVVWRRDAAPAYELAVVVDDHAMEIEEVVRGADLLTSTARQLLLYEALGWIPPAFFHTPLIRDQAGRRLAKRGGGLSIRHLRDRGLSPADVLKAPVADLLATP